MAETKYDGVGEPIAEELTELIAARDNAHAAADEYKHQELVVTGANIELARLGTLARDAATKLDDALTKCGLSRDSFRFLFK